MLFKINAQDRSTSAFTAAAAAAELLAKKLDALDKKTVKPKITLDGADMARARVTELNAALKELRNTRVRVDADLGSSKAAVGDLRRELSYLRDKKIKVEVTGAAAAATAAAGLRTALGGLADTDVQVRLQGAAGVLTEVTRLRDRLAELRDVKIKVEVESGEARAELTAIARAARRLNGLNGADIKVKIQVDDGDSLAKLTAIATLLREIRGNTRVRVDADGSAESTLARTSVAFLKLAALSAVPLIIPGLINAVGQVGSLGSSVVALTGVLGLIPGAGAVAAAGIATLVVGLQGFGDAMKNRADPAKFAESLKNLSPAAAQAATAVRDLGPAWTSVRLDTQERLFAGLGDTINKVSSAYLPTMRSGLGGIATELNTGAKDFAAWATEGRTVADVNTILGNTRVTVGALSPAMRDVTAALTDVAVVGSGLMPELAGGASRAAAGFREFVAEARESGRLEEWMRGGIDTLAQLGRIAVNTGGILASVFSASSEAGFSFLDAVERVTGELDTLLSSVQGRRDLVSLFQEAGQATDALMPGVRELGSAALEMLGNFARSDGLESFAGLVGRTASALAPLVVQLGAVAGDGLGKLSDAASIGVAALSPLVGGAAAVSEGLGPIPGLALASFVAFKGAGIAGAGMASLATRIAATSSAAGLYATALTGSMAAGSAANTATTRLAGAIGAVGKALPIVGLAAVAVGAAWDGLTISTSEAASALQQGGAAAASAVQGLRTQTSAVAGLAAVFPGLGSVLSDILPTYESFREGLDGVGRAQLDAAAKQVAYTNAVAEFGPNSNQARAASADLAAAVNAVEIAQRDAAAATRTHADALSATIATIQTGLGANLQLEDSLARVAQAQDKANEAVRQHGAESEQGQAAIRSYVQAVEQAAQAAGAQAAALAQAEGRTDSANVAALTYGASLLQMAANAEGPARDGLLGYVATLSDAQLGALSAASAASGFATQILTLPDGRTVTIAVDPETGEIISTQALLDGMQDANVVINADAMPAIAALDGLIGRVNGAAGTVVVNGNPEPAGVALQTVLGAIAAGQASVTINGQEMPARAALDAVLGQIGASNATVTINGQSVPAAAALGDIIGAISRGQGTVTIAGQAIPAEAALAAVMGQVNRSNGTLTINGRDGGVAALKAQLSLPSSSTHTINVKTVGVIPKAQGGIVRPMASGGVLTRTSLGQPVRAMAGGGSPWGTFRGREIGLMPAVASAVPPNTPRLIGDRLSGTEIYIPLDGSRRSLGYTRYAASQQGFDLAPRGQRRSIGGGSPRSIGPLAVDPRTFGVRQPALNLAPVVAALVRGNAGLRAELVALGSVLRAQRGGVTVQQTIATTNPTEAGAASAMAIRLATR